MSTAYLRRSHRCCDILQASSQPEMVSGKLISRKLLFTVHDFVYSLICLSSFSSYFFSHFSKLSPCISAVLSPHLKSFFFLTLWPSRSLRSFLLIVYVFPLSLFPLSFFYKLSSSRTGRWFALYLLCTCSVISPACIVQSPQWTTSRIILQLTIQLVDTEMLTIFTERIKDKSRRWTNAWIDVFRTVTTRRVSTARHWSKTKWLVRCARDSKRCARLVGRVEPVNDCPSSTSEVWALASHGLTTERLVGSTRCTPGCFGIASNERLGGI